MLKYFYNIGVTQFTFLEAESRVTWLNYASLSGLKPASRKVFKPNCVSPIIMKQAYVVTEGKSDVELLKRVLPKSIVKDAEFIAGSGRYSAQSLTRSILAVKQLPTAIVADSDTEDESTIQEQKDFLRESLHQASAGIQFEIFLAVPEIEIVFFQEPALLEKLARQNFSNIEWEMAKSHPKEFWLNGNSGGKLPGS